MPKPSNRLAVQSSIVTPDFVIAHDWHHHGTTLAVALSSGPVLLVDPKTGAIQRELPGHGIGTMSVQFQSNGDLVATAGQDGTAKLWDSTTGDLKSTLAGGASWVEHVAWKPDGTVLATAAGKLARLWNPITGEQIAEYGPHGSTIANIAWQPGTNRLSVAGLRRSELVRRHTSATLCRSSTGKVPSWSCVGAETGNFWPTAIRMPASTTGTRPPAKTCT